MTSSITVITATLNSSNTLERSLLSAIGQRGISLELIIVDGGSSDNSIELARSLADQLGFRNLKFFDGGGLFNSLNIGIRNVQTDYFCFLHSDDFFLHPFVLRDSLNLMIEKELDIMTSGIAFSVGETLPTVLNKRSAVPLRLRNLATGSVPPHPSILYRSGARDWFFDESFEIAGDYDALLKFSADKDLIVGTTVELSVGFSYGGVSTAGLRSRVVALGEDIRIATKQFGYIGVVAVFFKKIVNLPYLFNSYTLRRYAFKK